MQSAVCALCTVQPTVVLVLREIAIICSVYHSYYYYFFFKFTLSFRCEFESLLI